MTFVSPAVAHVMPALTDALNKLPRPADIDEDDWNERVALHAAHIATHLKTNRPRDINWSDNSKWEARDKLKELHKRYRALQSFLRSTEFNQDAVISMAEAGAWRNSLASIQEYKSDVDRKTEQVIQALENYSGPEMKKRPQRRHAKRIGRAALKAFEDLTGKPAGITYKSATDERSGYFVELVTEVFRILRPVDGSPSSIADTLVKEAKNARA